MMIVQHPKRLVPPNLDREIYNTWRSRIENYLGQAQGPNRRRAIDLGISRQLTCYLKATYV